MIDIKEIENQAKKEEYEQELFREAVEKAKEKLRHKKPIWQKIFPFKIIIVRR